MFDLLWSMLLQQNTHSIAQTICQRCNRFSGYPREEKADAHIDGKIDRNVQRVVHAGAVKVIVEEYIQRLHNQKLPYNQGKALFPQKLCKLVAKQAVIAKAAMYADNHEACSKCIERNHIYEAWQQHRGE